MNEIGLDGERCLRCDYDLRGIENAQPCPECGLLAERSRRVSDELHDTRPRWLRSLSRGVWLMLLALALLVTSPLVGAWLHRWVAEYLWTAGIAPLSQYSLVLSLLRWISLDVAALLFLLGAMALTVRENYPPADRADAKLRRMVRIAAAVPLVAVLLMNAQALFDTWYRANRAWYPGWRPTEIAAATLATVGCWPLPLLIFMRLRGLAKRARSAHLAEHCAIVGAGASAALIYTTVAALLLYNGNAWFGQHWTARSTWSLMLTLGIATFAALFALWSLYLLVRFGIALAKAARAMNRKWRASDRARRLVNA